MLVFLLFSRSVVVGLVFFFFFSLFVAVYVSYVFTLLLIFVWDLPWAISREEKKKEEEKDDTFSWNWWLLIHLFSHLELIWCYNSCYRVGLWFDTRSPVCWVCYLDFACQVINLSSSVLLVPLIHAWQKLLNICNQSYRWILSPRHRMLLRLPRR